MRAPWRVCLVASMWLAGSCDGCAGCGDDPTLVAELESVEGSVDRDHADAVGQWAPAEQGGTFHVGDGLRTGQDSRAELRLTPAGRMKVEPESEVRFQERPPDEGPSRVEVQSGAAELRTAEAGMEVQTQVGRARLQGNSRMRITADEAGVRFDVLTGKAKISSGDDTRELAAGETFDIEVGRAELRPDEEPAEADAGAAQAQDVDAGEPEVADGPVTVEVRRGRVRARRPGERRWSRLRRGEASIEAGSEVRLARRASLEVRRGRERARMDGAGRAVVGPESGALLEARRGAVTAESGDEAMHVDVPGGAIVVRPRSRVAADVHRDGSVRATPERGSAVLRTDDGEEAVQLGEWATLEPGEGLEAHGRAPETEDLRVAAGETFTVHDPDPPTHLAMTFETACDGRAALEVHERRRRSEPKLSVGEGSARVALGSGSYRYRVRCVEDGELAGGAEHAGRIRVAHDSGTQPLPRRPQQVTVDADGRRYTVQYSTRLPTVTVRWPGAPSTGSYTLTMKSRGGTLRKKSSRPRVTFRSGRLSEGTHRFRFAKADGRRSAESTLRIEFDNQATSAHLRQPPEGGARPGEEVTVSGVALPGSRVTVAGRSVPLDGAGRFRDRATAPAGRQAMAVRVQHPQTGIHYYLRHLGDGG